MQAFFIYLFIYFSLVRNKCNEIHVLTLLHSSTSFSVTVSFAMSVGRGSKSCLNVQHMNRINFHYRKKYMNTFKYSQRRWPFHVLKRCLCYILAKNSQWLTTLSMVDYIVNTSIPASCYKAVFHRSPWASILYSAPVLPDLQNIFPFKVFIQSYFHD